MQCPKCQTKMDLKNISDVEIDLCPACEGVWLDWGEAVRLRKHLRQYSSPTEILLKVIKKHGKLEAKKHIPPVL